MSAIQAAGATGGASVDVTASSEGWIWGRAPDLLLGCGLGYLLLMPPLLWLASHLELRAWPLVLGPAVTLLISGPHYGATLLRAYERREERRKYALFTVWISLGIAGVTLAALRDLWLGSVLVTLYFTWSPWHFAGQNYGLALLFLRRRGIAISTGEKRLLYASFVLSSVLAVLPIHTQQPNVSYALEVTGQTAGYHMLRLGIPNEVALPILVGAAVAYAGCLLRVAAALRQRASWRELGPAILLVATQALWFAIPGLVPDAYSANALVLTAVWINLAHGVQYLWITSHYARREGTGVRLGTYLVKATLAGSAVGFVPALLLAPALSYEAGSVLIASAVNLHHFILDGAIWKLRDGRVARVLLRAAPEDDRTPAARRPRSWIIVAVLASGAAGLAVNGFDLEQRRILSDPGVGAATARAALERLAWIGREPPSAHLALGQRLADRGDLDGALSEFRRALVLSPEDARIWRRIGAVHERGNRLPEALAAYQSALAVSPDDGKSMFRAALVGLALAEGSPRPENAADVRAQAIARLERLLSIAPAHRAAARRLARVYAEDGRTADALRVLDAAIAAAKSRDDRADLRRAAHLLRERSRSSGEHTRL